MRLTPFIMAYVKKVIFIALFQLLLYKKQHNVSAVKKSGRFQENHYPNISSSNYQLFEIKTTML